LVLVGCNNPPGPATIVISPAEPITADDLEVVILSKSADPNRRDTVTYEALWYQDGALRDDFTGMIVAGDHTTKNEVWKVILIPSDGEFDGPPVSAEVTVRNSPPSAEVSVDIAAPGSGDAVTASASATDLDGDDVSLSFAWSVGSDGRQVEGATLPASETARGDVWTISATPNDGEDDGEPARVSVSIDNAAPVVESVSIAPAEAGEETPLTAVVVAADADGDPIALHCAWWVDGTEVQAGEDATLTGDLFDKHDDVFIVVTPNDGFIDGAAVTSASITIRNTPPSAPTLSLSPDSPRGGADDLVCTVESPSIDADGDPITYALTWDVDGAPYTASGHQRAHR
jgi:hypothetical protein